MLTFYLSLAVTEEDRDMITYIYENFYPLMKHIAFKYAQKPEDAEDIVQESMLSIIECIGKIKTADKNRLKNFCAIVAKNKAIDFYKAKNKRIFLSDEILEFADDTVDIPEEILLQKENHYLILKAIYSLGDIYRDVCILKYVHQFKVKEISALLNVDQSTINVRIYRAKRILREALGKEFIRG